MIGSFGATKTSNKPDLKADFNAIAADGIVDTEEHAHFIALLDTFQKSIEAERAEYKEQMRQQSRNSFIICTTILAASFLYIITVLNQFQIPLNDIVFEALGFVYTITMTLVGLAFKGYIKESAVYVFIADILRAIFFKAKKPLPDVPEVPAPQPATAPPTTPPTPPPQPAA